LDELDTPENSDEEEHGEISDLASTPYAAASIHQSTGEATVWGASTSPTCGSDVNRGNSSNSIAPGIQASQRSISDDRGTGSSERTALGWAAALPDSDSLSSGELLAVMSTPPTLEDIIDAFSPRECVQGSWTKDETTNEQIPPTLADIMEAFSSIEDSQGPSSEDKTTEGEIPPTLKDKMDSVSPRERSQGTSTEDATTEDESTEDETTEDGFYLSFRQLMRSMNGNRVRRKYYKRL
jgi:hypothetical protein